MKIIEADNFSGAVAQIFGMKLAVSVHVYHKPLSIMVARKLWNVIP